MSDDLTRRRLLGLAAAGTVGVAAGVGADRALASPSQSPAPTAASVPVAGPRDPDTGRRLRPADSLAPVHQQLQPGIAGRVPAFGHVVAVDLTPRTRQSPSRARTTAAALLTRWTKLAAAAASDRLEGPTDLAAAGLRPAMLEVTVGIGASLLDACGLSARRPAALVDLPAFATDRLRAAYTGGDLLVQVGAEDPMKAAGAVQSVLSGLGTGARVRWSQPGFRQTTAVTDDPAQTPRNLMGHRDGTNNPVVGSPLWDATVISRQNGVATWMDGGSYLVARKIAIDLDRWFTGSEHEHALVIGRRPVDGAPLSGGREHTLVNLDATNAHGALSIPAHAHIRLASTRSTAGARIYRRPWNYDNGWDDRGQRDAGLVFLAWQADPRRGFLPIQTSLTTGHDALNAFTSHIGSAVFAVPPRPLPGEYLAQHLIED